MGVESGIQSEVVAYARSYGLTAKKMESGEGWPDYMFLGKAKVLFIEFKAPGEGPTLKQQEMIKILVDHGITVRVVDNVEEGKDIIFIYFQLWTSSLGGTPQSS